MSSPPTTTPSSGKSAYFDAPVAHFHSGPQNDTDPKNMSAATTQAAGADVQRNPSVANAPITNGTGKVSEKTALAEESEAGAPDYTPGPDDKLSRSYGTDAKTEATSPTTTNDSAPINGVAATDYAPTISPSAGSGHKQEGSTFANGASVTGPNAAVSAEEEAALHQRTATAESGLSEKVKSRLSKAEMKDNKRLSKIIRAEGKAEAAALKTAITELSQLQAQQTLATKREAKAHAVHAKALALHMKTESKYMLLKAEYERNAGDMRAKEEALEAERANAREVSERTAEQAKEVERLRLQTAADEREREAKLNEMGTNGGGFLCF
ncbi:hypothetical protein HWV62_24968 [Athelia sp. TMB]|nr:hypothetical protein HWV62_24968 [Athelia sp. TMB]